VSAKIDISGRIYNDIYVVEYLECRKTQAIYKCICMLCGNVIEVSYSNLKSKNTKSCGSCGKKLFNYKKEFEIAQRIKSGEKIVHLAKEYGINRSVLYRIKSEYLES